MRRWSPYNYGFNNPIKFIDPDGMGPEWIRGTDGKRVTYTTNKDGTVYWSKNASADTKRIGNALAANGGINDLNRARDVKHAVDFTYSSQITPNKLGEMIPHSDSKTGALISTEVVIYGGNMKLIKKL